LQDACLEALKHRAELDAHSIASVFRILAETLPDDDACVSLGGRPISRRDLYREAVEHGSVDFRTYMGTARRSS
jgi:hypothetical protein